MLTILILMVQTICYLGQFHYKLDTLSVFVLFPICHFHLCWHPYLSSTHLSNILYLFFLVQNHFLNRLLFYLVVINQTCFYTMYESSMYLHIKSICCSSTCRDLYHWICPCSKSTSFLFFYYIFFICYSTIFSIWWILKNSIIITVPFFFFNITTFAVYFLLLNLHRLFHLVLYLHLNQHNILHKMQFHLLLVHLLNLNLLLLFFLFFLLYKYLFLL